MGGLFEGPSATEPSRSLGWQVRADAEQANARLLELDAAERLSQLLIQRADPTAYAATADCSARSTRT